MAIHDAPRASPPSPSSSPLAYDAGSGSTTNPNTPRPDDVPDQSEPLHSLPEDVHTPAVGLATSPYTLGAGQGGAGAGAGAETCAENETRRISGQGLLEPEHEPEQAPSSASPSSGGLPRKFSLSAADALVHVQDDSHLEVQLSLDWIPAGRGHDAAVAFFKVRQRVHLDGLPASHPVDRNGLVSVFLYIPPERIRRLSLDTQPSETTRPRAGFKTAVALSFEMARPPSLVFPKALAPGHDALREPLATLHMLASQPVFTIHANIPARTFPAAELRRLCAAVSAHDVSSIAHLGFRTLPTLYAGHGAQLVDGHHHQPAAAPPAYGDIATTPDETPESSRARYNKRRRQDSPGPSKTPAGPGPGPEALPASLAAAVDALLDARFSAHLQEVRDTHEAFRAEVTGLLHRHKSDVLGMLAAHKAEVAESIASSDVRVSNAVIDEVSDLIRESVSSEAGEIEEAIMERITSMPLRAELTFPDHPLY